MGCDISVHVEIKLEGRWEHFCDPNTDRNYELFGLLAGVRGGYAPVIEPRGLPKDANPLTAYLLRSFDLHTHSHLNIDDLMKVSDRLKEINGPNIPSAWNFLFDSDYLLDWCDPFPFVNRGAAIEDIRIVFAFDS